MLVIPAIDIRGGKCVRLKQGDFDRQTTYDTDPVAVAKRWEAEGAKLLHIVDLDGAKDGISANLAVIRKIAQSLAIPVEVGGGIRSIQAAETLLSSGVARVVLGTMAFEDRTSLKTLLKKYAPRIVVALETKDGKLVTRGWQQSVGGDLLATAQELQNTGAQRFLYTDVTKDGMLTEPNYKEIANLVQALSVPIIASGGVSILETIKKLRAIGPEAVIVGTALYEGTLNLKEANNVS
jgi:phosphoribosylformimino-5-aminoimidazole carboxamide ribotide isomerase